MSLLRYIQATAHRGIETTTCLARCFVTVWMAARVKIIRISKVIHCESAHCGPDQAAVRHFTMVMATVGSNPPDRTMRSTWPLEASWAAPVQGHVIYLAWQTADVAHCVLEVWLRAILHP